jgi:hypothetical protein
VQISICFLVIYAGGKGNFYFWRTHTHVGSFRQFCFPHTNFSPLIYFETFFLKLPKLQSGTFHVEIAKNFCKHSQMISFEVQRSMLKLTHMRQPWPLMNLFNVTFTATVLMCTQFNIVKTQHRLDLLSRLKTNANAPQKNTEKKKCTSNCCTTRRHTNQFIFNQFLQPSAMKSN